MKSIKAAGVLVILLCVFASVSHAQSVQSDFDRSISLSKLKTFNFAVQRRGPVDPLANDTLNDSRIRTAISNQLSANGYSMETSTMPDFAVAYYVTTKNKLNVQDYSYGPPRFWGRRDIRVDQYSEGTLTVDLIDTNTNQLIWRGRVSGAVELKNLDKKIDKAVQKLVKQLVKDSTRKS